MALPIAALVCTVLVLACVAGPVLARSNWPTAHPASALLCWAAALTGTVLALSGLLLLGLLWSPGVGHTLMEFAHGCLDAHRHRGAAIAVVAGLAALTVVTVRMTGAVSRLRRALGHRRRHREMLGLVARTDEHNRDVLVLDHPLPVAYCLPVRERPIVVSSGARKGLSPEQFAAVLAHERAHLRHRHHLLLLLLDLAGAVLPWPPTARLARGHIPLLIEMVADDAAARACGVSAVTGALRRLITASMGTAGPLGTAGPGGSTAGTAGTEGQYGGSGPLGALAATGPAAGAMTGRLARLDSLHGEDGRGGRNGTSRYLVRAVGWAFAGGALTAPAVATTAAIAGLAALC